MTLQSPLWLLILPAVAVVAVAAARARLRDRRALAPSWVVSDRGAGRGGVGRGAELAACALLGVALSAPQFPTEGDARREPSPVIFVVDGSRSMLEEDVAPDRFAAAAARLLERVRAEPGRRFGIVVFAGAATEICPPTADAEALATLLAEVHPRHRPDPGSDVSLGIVRALSRFDAGRGGEIVVLSDGEWDGEERALAEAASRARELGVRIDAERFGGAAPDRIAGLAGAGAAFSTVAPTPDAGTLAARRLRAFLATGLLLLAAAHGLSGRTS